MDHTEHARRILEDAGATPDPAAHDLYELVDNRTLESRDFLEGITPLRRHLKLPTEPGGHVRPSREFYEVFLGHGRAGAEALLRSFEDALPDAPDSREKYEPTWLAVVTAARCAASKGLISWNLNGWRPSTHDPTRSKVACFLPLELAEKVRRMAFESRTTVTAIVEDALAEVVERHEEEHGPLATRPSPDKRAAPATPAAATA